MNYKQVWWAIAVAGIMTACFTSKKIAVNPETTVIEQPSVMLDTIKVLAEENPKKRIYRATETILNDIIHTTLWVSFDWQKSQLMGKAKLQIKPYFYPTNTLYLNARGMELKSVTLSEQQRTNLPIKKGINPAVTEHIVIEKPLSYTYENDSIKINLGKAYTAQEQYNVTINYVAKPNNLKTTGSEAITQDKGLYFINPTGEDPDKMTQLWTQGETQSNSAWFPTIDNPHEKMTNEIYMTVDDRYLTLSNGILTDSKKNANGTRTDHWKMDLPHAPYLVMMAVGEFKKVTDEPWNGKEISYYVEKEYEPHAKAIFGKTKKMMDFYSNKLGVPYTWPKYAQIVVRDYVSGAMENTSATLHGDFMVYQTTREMLDGAKGESVIAHELFHQWFGNLVGCESWSNLPLNESFATYGEYLWHEFENGRNAADAHHAQSRNGYMMAAAQKQVDLVRFDYDAREDMFDAFSYNKGGQVLHMLRKYVGDDAFFASLRLYLETHKFKTAEVHDLRLAFEEVTGEDLNWFFNEWFYAKGHPKLSIKKTYQANTNTLILDITQQQDIALAPLYKLPIDVDLYVAGKKERQRIWIDDSHNTFAFNVLSNPELVNVDAEKQLLAEITYEKTKEEYIFQYKNAPLWEDRKEAIDYFKENSNEEKIFELLKLIAQNDPWYTFRNEAIKTLSKIAKNKGADLKPLFIGIYNKDTSTKVRATALKALSENYADEDINVLYENALKDSSYAIVAEAIDAIANINPNLALEKAKTFEKEPCKDLIYTIADLYAKHGSEEQYAYFKVIKRRFKGYELMAYGNIYGKFLKRLTNPNTVLDGANELVKMGISDNPYVKYTAQKVMKDLLLKTWQDREDALEARIETAKKEHQDTTALATELHNVSDTKQRLLELYHTMKK